MAAHERERSQRLAQTSRRLHEAMAAADVQRAQMAAAASVAATAAASGSSNEQPGTSNKTYVAKAALKAVERQRAAYAKAAAAAAAELEHWSSSSGVHCPICPEHGPGRAATG